MGGGALAAMVFNISGDYILLFEADESCGASPQGKNIVYAHKYNFIYKFFRCSLTPKPINRVPQIKNPLTEKIRELKSKV